MGDVDLLVLSLLPRRATVGLPFCFCPLRFKGVRLNCTLYEGFPAVSFGHLEECILKGMRAQTARSAVTSWSSHPHWSNTPTPQIGTSVRFQLIFRNLITFSTWGYQRVAPLEMHHMNCVRHPSELSNCFLSISLAPLNASYESSSELSELYARSWPLLWTYLWLYFQGYLFYNNGLLK